MTLSKYQDIMSHVQVDDEMKKRILQNVEKELGRESDGKERDKETVTPVPAPKKKIVDFRRYAAIAATFAVLLIGSYAVIQITGGIKNTSSTMSDSTSAPAASAEPAMTTEAPAPAMEEAEEAVAEAAPYEEMSPYTATESAGAANDSLEAAKMADITIKYENAVTTGNVWIIDNTEANRKTTIWGTATIRGAEKDTEYSLEIPQNADDSYLFRMVDKDGIYYESDAITLKEGYSISIFLEGEFDDVRMVIRDENGEIVGDEILFNAAL
jgi:hypothetical protein